MPLYAYRCGECDNRVEYFQRVEFRDSPKTCFGCGASALKRQLSPTVLLKRKTAGGQRKSPADDYPRQGGYGVNVHGDGVELIGNAFGPGMRAAVRAEHGTVDMKNNWVHADDAVVLGEGGSIRAENTMHEPDGPALETDPD